ncbi:protein ULTRelated to AP2ETALA 1-like [Forsythia ovata]|uniref:Protein ULTRelated to AP2ETALA 1-like n=1 Tax=Forsythia ovata TaxID=205694 RepID=A0ABD1RZH4_9LAMI
MDKLTPIAFEKHSGRETARKWKNNIWVIVDGEKVPIFKTALLKYYNIASKSSNGMRRSQNGKACHRDKFIRCSECNKLRRFRLRSKEECRIYHDALLNLNLKCSDMPYDKITCDEDEERASRRVYRAVHDLQHAKDALPVCALDVKFVVSRTAATRCVQISQEMQKLIDAKKLFFANLFFIRRAHALQYYSLFNKMEKSAAKPAVNSPLGITHPSPAKPPLPRKSLISSVLKTPGKFLRADAITPQNTKG